MKLFRHIILVLTALILASCAVDEFWEGTDYAEGEEVVMTFKPRFEDFESVTKAIGDGSQVDQLLVHVYEEGSDKPEEKTYGISSCQVQQEVKIPFFYGKKYKVYFWAYKSGNDSPYTVSNIGLKGGVSVNYPDGELGFNALESLDAFYAVSDVDLSNGRTMDINLTRPFAQVNLVADEEELLKAQASKVEFIINVAKTFNLTSPTVEKTPDEQTFTFTIPKNFQNTEKLGENVYLGTTYLFVPSSGKVTGKVKLYAGDNVLKSAENIEIPLVGNKRTNLVFSGFQISVPEWDSSKETVPGASDGWIIITEPEQLAALLMTGTTENTQVRIGSTLNMEKMPQEVKNQIVGKSYSSLTLDGNYLTIKNFSAPAFFANATNLKVSNLTLENVNITAATHVGVLVNELKGNGTFTDVTVKGSSATTTDGAAGGFVGRSVRIDEKDRKETLALTFTGCRIEGTDDKKIVATGSLAEGKFVGLFSGYDNGEKLVFTNCTSKNAIVADYDSRYVDGNKGAWLAGNDYSAYNGFLGDETYLRGKVYFGGENEAKNRFCPKWDGTTNTTELDIEPLLANDTYDAGTTAGDHMYVVYSAFDLAGVRKKTASPAALYLMTNVDMFGQGKDGNYNIHSNFTQSKIESTDDNVFSPFNSITLLEGKNYGIYNLSMTTVGTTSYQAAFVINGYSNNIHQNISFHNCCTVVPHVEKEGEDKSYGATFILSVSGDNYKMENVHADNCRVFAIQKTAILAGRVMSDTSNGATINNCSVTNCYVENYKCEDNLETFSGGSGSITVTADFYSYGEIGGLIGFVMNKATISNCSVSKTKLHAYGQNNKSATITGLGIKVGTIAGRHVNEFIGDIRCVKSQEVLITNCSIYGNEYGQDKHTHTKGNTVLAIGQAYYVGGKFIFIEFGEAKGTLNVQNIDNNGSTLFTKKTSITLQGVL